MIYLLDQENCGLITWTSISCGHTSQAYYKSAFLAHFFFANRCILWIYVVIIERNVHKSGI